MLDVFDVVALVVGILLTIRKLSVRRCEPGQFPHVPAGDFHAWQRRQLRVYNLGIWACFLKIVLDYGFQTLAVRIGLSGGWYRFGGMFIDLSWLGTLIVVGLVSGSVRRERHRLGIDPGRAKSAPEEGAAQ